MPFARPNISSDTVFMKPDIYFPDVYSEPTQIFLTQNITYYQNRTNLKPEEFDLSLESNLSSRSGVEIQLGLLILDKYGKLIRFLLQLFKRIYFSSIKKITFSLHLKNIF